MSAPLEINSPWTMPGFDANAPALQPAINIPHYDSGQPEPSDAVAVDVITAAQDANSNPFQGG